MSLDHFKHSITYSKIKTDFDYKIDSDMAFLLIINEMEKSYKCDSFQIENDIISCSLTNNIDKSTMRIYGVENDKIISDSDIKSTIIIILKLKDVVSILSVKNIDCTFSNFFGTHAFSSKFEILDTILVEPANSLQSVTMIEINLKIKSIIQSIIRQRRIDSIL